MNAFMRLSLLLALLAAQLDAPRREERTRRGGVDHLDEARVKIDF